MSRFLLVTLLAAACSDDKPAEKPTAAPPTPDAAPPVVVDAPRPDAAIAAPDGGLGELGTIGHGKGGSTGMAPTASAGRLANVYGRGFSVEIDDPTVAQHLAEIKACYANGLYRKPTLGGTLTVRVELSATGEVSSATATGVDKTVAKCVADVVESIAFPAPATGAPATITVPIELSPKRS